MSLLNRRRLLQMLPAVAAIPSLPRANAQERPNQPLAQVPRAVRPTREVRAIWIHPEQHTDADEKTGKAQIKAAVDRYARANFNLILPWTVSGYLAALEHEQYRKDHPTARWDWLGYLIETSAKAGMDVDMWYSFTDYRDAKSPEFDPALSGSPKWMARRIDEVQSNQTVMKLDKRVDNVCPQHFQARRWMQAQLERTIARYPKLHGLHIEEPGYGTKGYCLCDLCTAVFEQLHGRPLIDSLETPQAEDVRTLGNSAMMEELRQQLADKHPHMLLSANGGHDWRHDRVRGRDWGRWGAAGWLRYYVPQVYVSSLGTFREQLALTLDDIGRSCPVYAGMALDSTSGRNTIQNIAQQIEAARDLGAAGVALFHGAAFTDEHLDVLRSGVFRKTA